MSDQPLPDDLRALLAAERERPDLDADRVASLFDRMSATLALPEPSAADAPDAPVPPAPAVAAPDPGIAVRLLQKYPVGSLLAALAIGLHLSHLAAGTAFGSPTTLPWGIDLWNATRHPTQIYELIASLIIFGIIWFRKSELSPGALFLNFTALTAGAHLFLEAFRADSTLILGGIRLAQVVAWVALTIVFITSEQKWQNAPDRK